MRRTALRMGIVMYGQLLASLKSIKDVELLPTLVEQGIPEATEKFLTLSTSTQNKQVIAVEKGLFSDGL